MPHNAISFYKHDHADSCESAIDDSRKISSICAACQDGALDNRVNSKAMDDQPTVSVVQVA